MTIRHAVAVLGVVAAVALATPAQDPSPPKAPAVDPAYGASVALARGAIGKHDVAVVGHLDARRIQFDCDRIEGIVYLERR